MNPVYGMIPFYVNLLTYVHHIHFKEARQGRLWSREGTEAASQASKEDICKQDSSSSTDTQNTVRSQIEVMRLRKDKKRTVQNLKVSSLETETMSQDSGYHGYLRQKSLEKESQKRRKDLSLRNKFVPLAFDCGTSLKIVRFPVWLN